MEHEQNFYAVEKQTWRDTLRWKLFPSRHCDLPDAPATYQDVLVCRTWLTVSWGDRVRLLLTGKFLIETRTVTEHEIGKNITNSAAYVLPPHWMERKTP